MATIFQLVLAPLLLTKLLPLHPTRSVKENPTRISRWEPVDRASAALLDGTVVDLPRGPGFRFDNPRARKSCSCGASFETCSLVLVPKGRNVDKVLFVSQKANAEIVFTRWTAKLS